MRVRSVAPCAPRDRITSVPAPWRAGSSTTMSGRPSADATRAGVTSPSRTRRLGSEAPLCRASAQARGSRSTARTDPDGPTGRPGGRRRGRHRRRGPPPPPPGSRRRSRGPPSAAQQRHPRAPARRPGARCGRCARRRWRARPRAGGGPFPHDEAGADVGEAGRRPAPSRHGDDRIGCRPVMTSISEAPGHRTASAPLSVTAGLATGHSSTYSSRWERWRRNPTAPRPSTAARTRLRQPSPSTSPATGSTSTDRSSPARRSSCSAMWNAFRRRCAPGSTCWKSQPPHRPGPACGHGGPTRSGEGVRISTASARR